MRKIISASLLLLLLFSTARAKEPAPSAELISNDRTPQQVLHDSLQALIDGQPERYVQSLTKEELDFQVGLVLLVGLQNKEQPISLQDKSGISLYLLQQNLLLLKKDFKAQEIQLEEIEQIIRAMNDHAINVSHYTPSSSTPIYLREAGQTVKAPEQFLIAVLKELMTPATGSDGVPVPGFEDHLVKFVKAVQSPSTTCYIRGRHAMLILADEKGTSSSPPAAIVMQQTPEGWKISQMLSLMLRGADLQDIINP